MKQGDINKTRSGLEVNFKFELVRVVLSGSMGCARGNVRIRVVAEFGF